MNLSNTNQNPIIGAIAVVETILLFIIGILGNKIAELLQISSNELLTYTIVGLGILAAINYTKSNNPNSNPSRALLIKFLPKTMLGIFPSGVILGLLAGVSLPALFPRPESLLTINPYETMGVFVGIILSFVFAIAVDSGLAAAISVGYGIAFATAILVIRPLENQVGWTYTGFIIGFTILATILVLADSLFLRLRKIVSEPRLQ